MSPKIDYNKSIEWHNGSGMYYPAEFVGSHDGKAIVFVPHYCHYEAYDNRGSSPHGFVRNIPPPPKVEERWLAMYHDDHGIVTVTTWASPPPAHKRLIGVTKVTVTEGEGMHA